MDEKRGPVGRMLMRLWEREAERPIVEHPEDTCQDCGGPNVVWFAPSAVWNQVMGNEAGIVCPTCFIRRSEEAGDQAIWVVRPQDEREATPALHPYQEGR